MRRFTLLAVVSLASCAPHLEFANEAGGVVNRTGTVGSESSYKLAREQCAKFGKIPKITGRDILTASMRFECVAK